MPGAKIVSRDWDDVAEGTPLNTGLGTSAQGQELHEPLRGWSSFSATFRVMFKEPIEIKPNQFYTASATLNVSIKMN